jgi:hypothetical protein
MKYIVEVIFTDILLNRLETNKKTILVAVKSLWARILHVKCCIGAGLTWVYMRFNEDFLKSLSAHI